LSGELTQNERTKALQSLRDGRARVCVATDVAARGIDLPNLGLVIHADLPNDPEVLQHRSGRTGRAGKKGVSVLLVVPARRRRAEFLLDLAGVDAVWATAPTVEEIRALDQQRMLQDTLFSEQATDDDLVLARALLTERSAEEIAAALARLYRSRLPRPKTFSILDKDAREIIVASGATAANHAAMIARHAQNRNHAPRCRKAASGSALPLAATRTLKRAGCCR
jgi:ATP-dependent RNA helicase DeaD